MARVARALIAAVLLASAAGCGKTRVEEAGFWFEPVRFQSKVLDLSLIHI